MWDYSTLFALLELKKISSTLIKLPSSQLIQTIFRSFMLVLKTH
jgi:hypothetical protein